MKIYQTNNQHIEKTTTIPKLSIFEED